MRALIRSPSFQGLSSEAQMAEASAAFSRLRPEFIDVPIERQVALIGASLDENSPSVGEQVYEFGRRMVAPTPEELPETLKMLVPDATIQDDFSRVLLVNSVYALLGLAGTVLARPAVAALASRAGVATGTTAETFLGFGSRITRPATFGQSVKAALIAAPTEGAIFSALDQTLLRQQFSPSDLLKETAFSTALDLGIRLPFLGADVQAMIPPASSVTPDASGPRWDMVVRGEQTSGSPPRMPPGLSPGPRPDIDVDLIYPTVSRALPNAQAPGLPGGGGPAGLPGGPSPALPGTGGPSALPVFPFNPRIIYDADAIARTYASTFGVSRGESVAFFSALFRDKDRGAARRAIEVFRKNPDFVTREAGSAMLDQARRILQPDVQVTPGPTATVRVMTKDGPLDLEVTRPSETRALVDRVRTNGESIDFARGPEALVGPVRALDNGLRPVDMARPDMNAQPDPKFKTRRAFDRDVPVLAEFGRLAELNETAGGRRVVVALRGPQRGGFPPGIDPKNLPGEIPLELEGLFNVERRFLGSDLPQGSRERILAGAGEILEAPSGRRVFVESAVPGANPQPGVVPLVSADTGQVVALMSPEDVLREVESGAFHVWDSPLRKLSTEELRRMVRTTNVVGLLDIAAELQSRAKGTHGLPTPSWARNLSDVASDGLKLSPTELGLKSLDLRKDLISISASFEKGKSAVPTRLRSKATAAGVDLSYTSGKAGQPTIKARLSIPCPPSRS